MSKNSQDTETKKFFKRARKYSSNDYLLGLKHGLPIGIGYLAVSFAFGMNVCASGFPAWLATLISLTNLTSAGQFAGTSLILAGGTILQLVVTMIVINSRYFLMGISVSQKLDPGISGVKRCIVAFGVTDEIFAVSTGRGVMLTFKYMIGLMTLPIIGWTGGTALGGLFASVLPSVVVAAFSSALYAMFIAIIIPPARDSVPVLITVVFAAALSIVFTYVNFFSFLSSGWGIVVVAILVSVIMAWLFPIKEETV